MNRNDRRSDVRLAALVAVLSLLGGVATSLGQRYLPDSVHSVANSTAPWTVVAFALSLLFRSAWRAAVAGGVALVGLLIGYEVASRVLVGYGLASRWWAFWGLCALTVGPAIGWLGARARDGSEAARVLLAGGLPGLAIGEGVHGLTVIGDTTSPVFWWIEIALGVAALATWGWSRRSPRTGALTTVLAVVVAGTFTLVYRGA